MTAALYHLIRKDLEMVFERMAARHWKKELPKMSAYLEKKGMFDQAVTEAAEAARKELVALVRNGMQLEAAKEIVLKEYILLPPETTE